MAIFEPEIPTGMRRIQMVDLKTQYQKLKQEIDSGVLDVFENATFINGPQVKLLEKQLAEYHDAHALKACGNGTDALQIALMALDLQPGDEVITTPFTFVSTAEVIMLLGLKPVFADIDPHTFNLDVEQVANAITEKTRCILPVHLFGQCTDMGPLMKLAGEHGLYVVEDNAQSIGAAYTLSDDAIKMAGSMGHLGTLSFYPSKNLSCFGDGGAVIINNNSLQDKVQSIANHGSSRRYYYDDIGVNSRLDTIQAVVLLEKLKHLQDYNNARKAVAAAYDEAFKPVEQITTPARLAHSSHVFHQYTIKVHHRDALKAHLDAAGVPSMIYYPKPLHLHPAYAALGYGEGSFPQAEQCAKEVLSLPMHTEMDNEQIDFITSTVIQFFKK